MAGRINQPTRVAMLAGAVLASGCYASSTTDCYYYYGYQYGYPYCDYDYMQPYTPSHGYEAVSYSEAEPQITPNPSPDLAGKLSDSSVQISAFVYVRRIADTGKTSADEVLDEQYPCGRGEKALTLCSVDNLRARDTDYILVAVQTEEPVEIDGERDSLVVGFAFDSDNDLGNNYVPPAERAYDYFGGTDRWYASTYTPDGGWKLQAYGLLDGAPAKIESEARVILQADTAVIIVPASEFATATPGARFSFFRYRGGTGTEADSEWTGLVFPPLGEPLAGL